MKKSVLLFLFLFLGSFTGFAATFAIDTAESGVKWTGTKITGQHHGQISLKSGALEFEGDTWVGGQAVIDMPTISVSDIENAEYNEKLKNHLKSEDFFDVANFATATLKIQKVNPLGEDKYDVTADLTIKGKTESIDFRAAVTHQSDTVLAQAILTIDRTKFGVRYGSGQFFQDLGDKLIHDEFTLNVTITAKQS